MKEGRNGRKERRNVGRVEGKKKRREGANTIHVRKVKERVCMYVAVCVIIERSTRLLVRWVV